MSYRPGGPPWFVYFRILYDWGPRYVTPPGRLVGSLVEVRSFFGHDPEDGKSPRRWSNLRGNSFMLEESGIQGSGRGGAGTPSVFGHVTNVSLVNYSVSTL